MCSDIQTLFNFEPSATEEVEAAGRRARAEKRVATA
jgi:hypothetical protein